MDSTKKTNPQIDVVYPLRFNKGHAEPFPTIYWLKPGELHRAVADMERRGFIKKIEKQIAEDEAFRKHVQQDHDRYARQRWEMLTPGHRKIIEDSPSMLRSFSGGIAGIADLNHVKCLHAHVAHALADRNAIGQAVLDALPA